MLTGKSGHFIKCFLGLQTIYLVRVEHTVWKRQGMGWGRGWGGGWGRRWGKGWGRGT